MDVTYLSCRVGRLFGLSRLLLRAQLFKMNLVIRPFSSDPFNMSWSLEPKVTRRFLQLVRPGVVVIDVGANVGWYSLLALSRQATVAAVEPDPENLAVLTRTSTLNRNRFRVLPYAIGTHDGCASLFLDRHTGQHSLNYFPHRRRIVVRQRSLSSVISELHLSSVDLVKLDTEGNEFDILYSSVPLLYKVKSWIVEVHDPARKNEADQFFRNHDYATEWLDENHIHATKREGVRSSTDFLFVVRST